MVLIHPYIPPAKELEERAKYMKVVKHRESGETLANDAFKATVVDNPLQLVTQFVTSANYDRYQIHLRDKILVAHSVSYEGILQDWQILEEKVNYMEIVNSNHPNKVQAILDVLNTVRKEQKGFGLDFGKQVYDTMSRLSIKPDDEKKKTEQPAQVTSPTSPTSPTTIKPLKVESDDDYQGDTETLPKGKTGKSGGDSPSRVVEEIFENERKSILGIYTKKNLLYTDKSGAWSTRNLVPKTKEQFELPPNWRWVGDWEVETDDNIDEDDGWRYAIDFNNTSWTLKPTKTTFVRRRRWIRERICNDLLEEPEASTTSAEEPGPLPDTSPKSPNFSKEQIFYGMIVAPFKKLTGDIFTQKKDGQKDPTSPSENAGEKSPTPDSLDKSRQPSSAASLEDKAREPRRRKNSKHKRVQSQQLLPLITAGTTPPDASPAELQKRPSSEGQEYTSHRVDVAPRDVVPVSHTIGLWSLIGLVALLNLVFVIANAWMLIGLGGQIEAIKRKI